MSLIIKGMKLPRSCSTCRFSYFTVGIRKRCEISSNEVNPLIDCRETNCPLKEVPTPHGRLIDADELIERIERFRDIHNYYPADIDATMRWFINQICGAKTIIGAELGKEANEVKKYRDYLASDTYAVCKRIENGEVSEK